jgi:beta-lactamase regulating signal transducer with metallopeptidase domain
VTLDGWTRPAYVVTTSFPIVAVVGAFRPKLLIARSVLEQCPADELAAILAHERAHVERRDNLARLLFAVTPDLLSWLPVSKRITVAWHDAAEESADESTASLGERGRVLLAQALIRVARMVPTGSSPAIVPASALYRGENIERRVRRLLDPIEPVSIRWTRRQRRAIRATFMTSCVLALEAIHHVVEAAVTHLP